METPGVSWSHIVLLGFHFEVTTATTAGSFYANCVSVLIVVKQFGFFMGPTVALGLASISCVDEFLLALMEPGWNQFFLLWKVLWWFGTTSMSW